jgi:hypothetical protein
MNLDNLRMWCDGLGIDPAVIDCPEMQEAINQKDGLAAYEVLRHKAVSLPGQQRENLDDGYQLEFMMMVQENYAGVLAAAALAGRFKYDVSA